MVTFATQFKYRNCIKNYPETTRKCRYVLFRSNADLEQEEAGQVTGIRDFSLLEKHNLYFSTLYKVSDNMFYINKSLPIDICCIYKYLYETLQAYFYWITSILTMSSALFLCPSLVKHLAIPSSTSLLMLRLLSEIHSRQLLYASEAFYTRQSTRTDT